MNGNDENVKFEWNLSFWKDGLRTKQFRFAFDQNGEEKKKDMIGGFSFKISSFSSFSRNPVQSEVRFRSERFRRGTCRRRQRRQRRCRRCLCRRCCRLQCVTPHKRDFFVKFYFTFVDDLTCAHTHTFFSLSLWDTHTRIPSQMDSSLISDDFFSCQKIDSFPVKILPENVSRWWRSYCRKKFF